MGEYIEREETIKTVVEMAVEIFDCHTTVPLLKFANKIRTIPTADVVEVVRCKDCEYYEPKNSLGTQGICMCGEKEMNYAGEFYPYENDFCSYGVRKEGAEE